MSRGDRGIAGSDCGEPGSGGRMGPGTEGHEQLGVALPRRTTSATFTNRGLRRPRGPPPSWRRARPFAKLSHGGELLSEVGWAESSKPNNLAPPRCWASKTQPNLRSPHLCAPVPGQGLFPAALQGCTRNGHATAWRRDVRGPGKAIQPQAQRIAAEASASGPRVRIDEL